MLTQNQQEEDQLYQQIDRRIPNKLQVSRVQVKNMIRSLQQSKNGKLLISVSASQPSLNVILSATFKLLMKRNYSNVTNFIADSCLSPNFKIFVITIPNGNFLIYQNFVKLVYNKKFEYQSNVKFITNEELLIWCSQYLIRFNVIKQQNVYEMALDRQFPINYLDFNIEKQLIFIGSRNIKIRSLNDGQLLLDSEQLNAGEIIYIKYQENNQIITRHKYKVIIIWKLKIDQSMIQQCQVIQALDNFVEISYSYIFRHDYIFNIQRIDRKGDQFAIIYTKTGSIINIKKLQLSDRESLAILLAGKYLNSERQENTCLFVEALDTIQKFTLKFKLPSE